MTNIDAKERIKTYDIESVKAEYVKDKVYAVNYSSSDNKKQIAFHDVRKDVEKPFIIAKAELDFGYYVTGTITQGEHQAFSNEIDEQMQIAVYEENEQQGNKYHKLKKIMENKIDILKEKSKTHKIKVV